MKVFKFIKSVLNKKRNKNTFDMIFKVSEEIKDFRKEMENHRQDKFIAVEGENRIAFWCSSGIVYLCYKIIESSSNQIYFIPMVFGIISIFSQYKAYRTYHKEIEKDFYTEDTKTYIWNFMMDMCLAISVISFMFFYIMSKY